MVAFELNELCGTYLSDRVPPSVYTFTEVIADTFDVEIFVIIRDAVPFYART